MLVTGSTFLCVVSGSVDVLFADQIGFWRSLVHKWNGVHVSLFS